MPDRAAPANVAIRRASLADEHALRSFRRAGDGEPWAVAPELTITLQVPVWVRDGTAQVWVAEEDDRVVGVIALTVDDVDPSIAVSQVLAAGATSAMSSSAPPWSGSPALTVFDVMTFFALPSTASRLAQRSCNGHSRSVVGTVTAIRGVPGLARRRGHPAGRARRRR